MTLGTVTVAILANLIGGIAPDIDEPTAPFWRNLPIGGIFGRILHVVVGGHRFLLHSLLGMLGMGLLLDLLLLFLRPSWPTLNADVVWWSFMIGYASHLASDSLTKEGVPWLLPIPIKFGFPPFKAWRITTGKFMEAFVVFPGLVLVELWLVHQNYGYLLSLLHTLGR
jgi:inner membrane protein